MIFPVFRDPSDKNPIELNQETLLNWGQSTLDFDFPRRETPADEIIRSIICECIGDNISFEQMSGGGTHFVYLVQGTNNTKCVLRVASPERRNALVGSIYWKQVVRELGVQTPEILHFDLSMTRHVYPYVFQSYLEGRELNKVFSFLNTQQLSDVAMGVAKSQLSISSISPIAGYGAVFSHLDTGFWRNWHDAVDFFSSYNREALLKALPESCQIIESIKRGRDKLQDYLSGVRQIPYFDDVTLKNVLVYKGRFGGIIDLDTIGFGDPLWPIANTKRQLIENGASFKYTDLLAQALGYQSSDVSDVVDFYTQVIGSYELARVVSRQKPDSIDDKTRRLQRWLFKESHG